MGNKNGRAIELAIIKRENVKPYEIKDYNKFFENKDLIAPSEYESFQDFIEKQSLKTLHHILIVEGAEDGKQFHKDKTNDSDFANYMLPIRKVLQKKQKSSSQPSIRDKVINYIKKYSLENLNLYFYVRRLKDFMVPESQVPYVTLVSSKAATIINHMLNEQSQKMVNVKFKGLMKDLYRRKLVAVIAKDWREKFQNELDQEKSKNYKDFKQNQQKKTEEKQKRHKEKPKQKQSEEKQRKISKSPKKLKEESKDIAKFNQKQYNLHVMLKEFNLPENRFQYLFVDSIDKFREKLKSMYFEFIICMDKENLLELIEFKKKMPVDTKVIYFGTKKDLQENTRQGELDTVAGKVILEKKLNEIWWICDNIEDEICPVMRKWWNHKYETEKNNKIATNVIIYLCRTQNIVRKREIQALIKQQIQSLSQKDLDGRQKGSDLQKRMNLTIQFKPDSINHRYYESLYTNIIMFDATNQEYEQMKKLAFSKFKGEPRLQVTMVEYKSKNNDSEFIERIKGSISKLQLKFQISPIQNIRCINIEDDDVEYFMNKMGLKVDVMNSAIVKQNQPIRNKDPVKKLLKAFEQFFPRFVGCTDHKINKKYQTSLEFMKILVSSTLKLTINSVFENFLVICSFEDYLRYLFPFFVMANLFKDKFIFETKSPDGKIMFDLLSERDFKTVQFYLEKIKVIIYEDINLSGKKESQTYDFNKVLKIHESQHDAISCIKEAIYEYLDVPYIKNTEIQLNIVKKRQDSPQKNKKIQDPEQRARDEKKENEIYKFIDWVKSNVILNKDSKITGKNESLNEAKIVFPNIVFAHYKISEIEEFINFYKYSKLSIPNFPKDSLKNFYKAYEKIETILTSRTFSLDATFVSSNNLLKDVFEKKDIQVSPKHKMDFVRFSTNRMSEVGIFEDYVKNYACLWKLKFELFKKDTQSKLLGERRNEAFKLLKNDVKRAFQKCKNYELLKITTSEFKHFYIDRIQKCQTLLDLQIAAIYIYSLPHGVSSIVSVIFEEPTKSALSIEIFSSFLFLLFANFYSLESRTLQKVSTVIYVNEEKIKNIYQTIRENEIIINHNILHILNDENETENEKNHCVFIEYENVPWLKRSSLTPILKIENFAFYKESAEFILAPFTKMKLREKKIVNKQYYKLYFDVITDQDSNIFLKKFFDLNGITDLAIFRTLDQKEQEKERAHKAKEMEQKQQDDEPGVYNMMKINHSKELKKQLRRASTIIPPKEKHSQQVSKKSNNKKPSQNQGNFSLYRQAEQTSLKEQKQIVRQSIRLILSYMNMLYSLKKNKLFSAEKFFYQIYFNTLNELDDNEDKKYQEIKEEMELQKLRVEKAMLYAKMNNFSKAIGELDGLLDFFQYEKVEEDSRGEWMKGKIVEMKNYIINMRKIRHAQIDKVKQVKKWTISMEENTDKNIQGRVKTVVSNPQCKWKVKFYDLQQTFIMENTNQMIEPKSYNVFAGFSNPQMLATQSLSKNQEKKSFSTQQQYTAPQSLSLGDLLFQLFDSDVRQINELDLRGKGPLMEQELAKMNAMFECMIKTKELRLMKLIHVFVKFWNDIVNKVESGKQIWRKLKDMPQKYILEKFLQMAEMVFFQFRNKTQKQKEKYKGLRVEEWFRDYLIYLQSKFTKEKMTLLRQELLEEHLEREENARQPEITGTGFSYCKKCWIDEQLGLHNQKMDWSVFQFDGKMIIVDAKRKWKQNVAAGLNVSGKTFARAENDVISLNKSRKSRIDPSNV